MTADGDVAEATLKIDLDALVANYALLQRQAAPAELAAVVKADAYGIGAAVVAATLAEAGCRHFFVAHFGEASALRAALPRPSSLYVLNGLPSGAEAACATSGAIPVLNSLDQIDRWSRHAAERGGRLPDVLQVDTGISRLGLPPDEVERLAQKPWRLDGIGLRLVISHLVHPGEVGAPADGHQVAAFAALARLFPRVPLSLDSSGGAFQPRDHYDRVRAGIALYGGAPVAGYPNPMRAVVSLEARVVQVRDLPAGAGVGYGASFRAERPSRIAMVGVGYADGWRRALSNCGSAYVSGRRVPIVGQISMDSMALDVTGLSDGLARSGASVELLGANQTIDQVAADAGTISYEILTRLGRRYAREYLPVALPGGNRSARA